MSNWLRFLNIFKGKPESKMGKRASELPFRAVNAMRISKDLPDDLSNRVKTAWSQSKLSKTEASLLNDWIERNRDMLTQWPSNILFERLREWLVADSLDDDDRDDLMETLQAFQLPHEYLARIRKTLTHLPLDKNVGKIKFAEQQYCFVGKFVYGPSAKCIATMKVLGAEGVLKVSAKTRYAIIGAATPPDEILTTYGRQIEQAIASKEKGKRLTLLSEEAWTDQLAHYF